MPAGFQGSGLQPNGAVCPSCGYWPIQGYEDRNCKCPKCGSGLGAPQAPRTPHELDEILAKQPNAPTSMVCLNLLQRIAARDHFDDGEVSQLVEAMQLIRDKVKGYFKATCLKTSIEVLSELDDVLRKYQV